MIGADSLHRQVYRPCQLRGAARRTLLPLRDTWLWVPIFERFRHTFAKKHAEKCLYWAYFHQLCRSDGRKPRSQLCVGMIHKLVYRYSVRKIHPRCRPQVKLYTATTPLCSLTNSYPMRSYTVLHPLPN